jgi:hypothetical protein
MHIVKPGTDSKEDQEQPSQANLAVVEENHSLVVQPTPEKTLGLTPSRFSFVNRRTKARLESYTGVLTAATAMIGAQTELEKAKARFVDLGRELGRLRKQAELEGLTLDNQIATEKLNSQNLEHRYRTQQELDALTHERDLLKTKLEIAELAAKIKEQEKPPEHEPRLSRDEQRLLRDAAHESRLHELRKKKRRAEKIKDEEERVRVLNIIDATIEREMEQWGKSL